ncbi:hypothetical protein TVAGG3_0235430 [Trichomonas vaginalis G3]|uniref:hypothetical protein n=1 Tax=Trichomonas vaginalis (strain ATCC PRA-98 / G3) TaxID=412133 RepID=UPI0021E5BC0F|nr:hypothetical protein TVAGG3_0235430 [Trichomonas vaginalis G3]KAI5552954.1 hypothetical protein TVAGG3_0235430 [Trichomonas vaginalis G3]
MSEAIAKLSPEAQTAFNRLESVGKARMGTFIIGHNGEPDTIKCSKFFGKTPCLPEEELFLCDECGEQKHLLVQLYVPSLPPNVQRLLPTELSDALLVFYYCLECLPCMGNHLDVKIYHPEDIEKLKYCNINRDELEEPEIFDSYTTAFTYDHESLYTYFDNEKIDDQDSDYIVLELDKLREDSSHSNCYFGGCAHFIQGDECPGPNWNLFLNIEEDEWNNFMWGDCGTAQIWVNSVEPNFVLTWSCS